MSFFKWISRINDLRLLATVSRLHKKGRLNAARLKIFEIVVSREDKFGKGTEPCAEPITWLAHEHIRRALEAITLMIHLEKGRIGSRSSLSPGVSFQLFALEQALASKWRHDMKKAFTYFALAKYGLPNSSQASLLQLEIEMYLGITSLAGPFGSDTGDAYKSAMVYLDSALKIAQALLHNEAEYNACDVAENLAEVILVIASDEKTKAIASQLKIDAENESAARADYASQIALLGRVA